ncbi:MAG: mercuric transporter MerT family protein [Rhodospirillales bacterium]
MDSVRHTPRPAISLPATGDLPDKRSRRLGLAAVGGLLGALAASSCCIAPLVLFSLGAGGAWIGNLTALAPYQPIFVVFTLGFLGTGFWMVYRRPKAALPEGSYCPRSVSGPWFKIALWSSTVLILAAMAFPYAAPLILDV